MRDGEMNMSVHTQIQDEMDLLVFERDTAGCRSVLVDDTSHPLLYEGLSFSVELGSSSCGIQNWSHGEFYYLFTVESLEISDSFKRSDSDNYGIMLKKLEYRRNLRKERHKEYRDRSIERAKRRIDREFLDIEFGEDVTDFQKHSRTHQKRHIRRNLRADYRSLLQSDLRHKQYKKSKQNDRRQIKSTFGDLYELFLNSNLMVEAKGKKKRILLNSTIKMELPQIPEDTTRDPSPQFWENYDVEELNEAKGVLYEDYSEAIERAKAEQLAEIQNRANLVVVEEEKCERIDEEFIPQPRRGKIIKKKNLKFGKQFNKISKAVRDGFDKAFKSSAGLMESVVGSTQNVFSEMKHSSVMDILKQCMRGNDGRGTGGFHVFSGIIVSCLAFLRLVFTIDFNFANLSSLTWLFLKAMGLTNGTTLLVSTVFPALESLVRICVNYFRDYMGTQKVELTVESLSESIDGFLAGTTNFLSHPLMVSVRNVVVFMAALHLFERPIASDIFRHLGKPEGFSIISLLTSVLSDISSMIRMGEAWLFGKPGTIDLFGENPLASSVAKLTQHLEMQELVYTGLPLEGFVERSTYINDLKKLIEAVEDSQKLAAKTEVKRLKVPLLIGNAKKTLGDFTGAAVSSFRQTPIGVIVHGPPGVGKSHVVKFIAYIHSLVKGRQFDPSLIYTRSGEFWEGYQPWCHPYVRYSESGKMKKSQARAKGDPINDELLSVIDNLPYPVNMAFKDKGKIFALPELVLIDTNNPSLNFDEMYENPAAFKRRFIYIEPMVKGKWSTTGEPGGDFDTSKPGASEAGADAWLFKVTVQKPVDNIKSEEKVLLNFNNKNGASALVKLLVPMFARHIAYEESVLSNVNKSMFSKYDLMVLSQASVHGAFVNKKAKVDVDDEMKVKIDPDSPYAKLSDATEKMKDAYKTARRKVVSKMVKTDKKVRKYLFGKSPPQELSQDWDGFLYDDTIDFTYSSPDGEGHYLRDVMYQLGKQDADDDDHFPDNFSLHEEDEEDEEEEEEYEEESDDNAPVNSGSQSDSEDEPERLFDPLESSGAVNFRQTVRTISNATVPVISEEKDIIEALITQEEKDSVITEQREDRYSLLKTLLTLPREKFIETAPDNYVLSDCANIFLERFTGEQITDFALSIGMYKSLRVAVKMEEGRRVAILEEMPLFSKEWRMASRVQFTREKIILPDAPIFSFIMKAMNGWGCMYDAWNYCNKKFFVEESIVHNMSSEASFSQFPYQILYEVPFSLWSVAILFFAKLWMSDGLIMNSYLSPNRVMLLFFTIACVWGQYYGPWIMFMTCFMVFLNVQDNLKVQGRAIVDKAIEDGLDSACFGLGSAVSWTRGTQDNTPKRGYLRYKTFLKFAGIAISGLAVYKIGTSLLGGTKKTKIQEVVVAYPSETKKRKEHVQIVNVTVGSDPSKKETPIVGPRSELTAETTFSKPSPYDDELTQREVAYHCGQSIERIPNKLDPAKWNVRIVPPPKYTGNVDDFIKMVGHNCRYATVDHRKGQRRTHVLGLFENFALVHRHAFFGDPLESMLMVSTTGYAMDESVARATRIVKESIVNLGNDLMLVQLNEIRFSNIMHHIPEFEHMPTITEAYIGKDRLGVAQRRQQPASIADGTESVKLIDYFLYSWVNHRPGMCGVPLVGQTGKGWVLMGIHSAGCGSTNVCASSTINKAKILVAVNLLRASTSLCPLASASVESVKTERPISKSVIHYEEMHGANYFGKLPGSVIMPGKSKVAPTGLNANGDIDEIFEEILHHKCTTEYGPPPMGAFVRDGQYFSPVNRFASKIGQQKQPLDRKILSLCVDKYTDRIVEGLMNLGRTQLRPWDLETAINGAVHDAYARAMDLSKASGYGRSGKKLNYFDVTETATGKWAEMIASLRADVLETLKAYDDGQSNLVFFEACLKDEPRDVKKCRIGKTRTFCVSPLVNLIITRMFFGPLFSTMVEQGDLFCTAIGTDMHRCAQDIYDRLSGHSDLILELDYGNYDQTMPYELGWAAGSVVYNICKRLGYSADALKVVAGLVSDNLHPFVVLNRDVFELPGYQPSGKYGTAEDNSLRGVLMLMYAWHHAEFKQHLPGRDFFKEVVPYVYGDDVVAAVSPVVGDIFNNITYSRFCEVHIGLECTPASKNSAFSTFVGLGTMMFLRRRFKKHKDFNRIVAPLDLDSLMKTLSWHIPSDSIPRVEQVIAANDSVIRELFFHCDEQEFLAISKKLYALVESKFNLNPGTLKRLSYMDLATATLCFSENRPVEKGGQDTDINSGSLGVEATMDDCKKSVAPEEVPVVKLKNSCFKKLHNSSSDCEVKEGTSDKQLASMTERRTALQIKVISGKATKEDFEEIRALTLSINFLLSLSNMRPESEMISGNSQETEEKMENLRDVSGMSVDETPRIRSFTTFNLDQTDVDLRKFLERPILIDSGPIALDTAFSKNYDLYDLLLEKSSIRSKLRYFSLFRAGLGVRLTISGTQFHQGRVMMGWLPWYNNCSSTSQAMNSAEVFSQCQYMSTISYQKTIDVKSNMPAEIHVPYISVQPMGRLYNNSNLALPNTTKFDDFVDMGRLCVRSIGVVEAVAAAPTTPYFQLYAWFEDVTYTMSTGTRIELSVESERKVGPVEKVTSKIAGAMSSLRGAPMIGPYAEASGMIASGVSQMAAVLGWSRPSLTTNTSRMRNEPYTCAANVVGADLSHRITLDPEQEVTVDPSVCAVHKDELVISDLCAREQLLYQATWSTSSTTMSPFFQSVVNPGVIRKSSLGNCAIPSPMALVSSYFDFWHGDITFRFDVVKTSFHRGKFAVLWEPNGPQRALIDANLSLNKNYIYIVDLQEVDNFEVTIKWATPRAWMSTGTSANCSVGIGSTIGTVSTNFFVRGCNGYISLVPITSLQAPLDKSVHINVYIKSSNMRFNHMRTPRDVPWDGTPAFAPIEGFDPLDEKDVAFEVESEEVGSSKSFSVVLNTAAASYDGISEYHFGEEPVSMRAVLKRYVTMCNIPVVGNPIASLTSSIIPPLDPPQLSSSLAWLDGGRLGILRRCFLGIRGGFKYRLRLMTDSDQTVLPSNSVTISLGDKESLETAFGLGVTSSYSGFAVDNLGGTVFIPYTQPGVEFEVPFYSTMLFHFAQQSNPLPDKYYTDPNQIRSWRAHFRAQAGANHRVIVDYVAGEDFSLMHFLSAPFMSIS